MALNTNKIPSTGGSDVTPLEAGNYPARVVQVIDLGLQAQRPYKGEEKKPAYMASITYELTSEFMPDEDGNDDLDRPRWVSEQIAVYSMDAELAKSTKRMKALDPKNQLKGDLAGIVGLPCTLTIVQNVNSKTGKVYANVGNVTPPMKGFDIPELTNEPKVFDLDSPDLEVFKSLPKWLQGKVQENLEYNGSNLQGLLEGGGQEEDAPAETENPY